MWPRKPLVETAPQTMKGAICTTYCNIITRTCLEHWPEHVCALSSERQWRASANGIPLDRGLLMGTSSRATAKSDPKKPIRKAVGDHCPSVAKEIRNQLFSPFVTVYGCLGILLRLGSYGLSDRTNKPAVRSMPIKKSSTARPRSVRASRMRAAKRKGST